MVICIFVLSMLGAQDETSSGEDDKLSYVLGNRMGQSLHDENLTIDIEVLIEGLKDGLKGHTRYGDAETAKVMREFQAEISRRRRENRAKELVQRKEEADAFLQENGAREGVVTLTSGLQYQVIQEGSGESPGIEDQVRVHYRGTLIDGKEFDSSLGGEPATFKVKGVIPGWIEALKLMQTGAKWKVFIPPALAYGPRGSGRSIPGNAALIFEIELLEILPRATDP